MDPRVLALSAAAENDASSQAARAVLAAPDPGAELDGIYRGLLRQRMLLAAIAHLERAGADLERLGVSAELYRRSWPLNSLFPTPGEPPGTRISLASIRSSLQTHGRLLQGLAARVTDIEKGAVLLFGRAFDAAYPSYRHRLDYDVDVLVSDMDTAERLLARLRTDLGFILGACKVSRSGGLWLGRLGLEASGPERHLLHVDLIVGGWPAGPGTLLPPWPLRPVVERAREVACRHGRAMVPAAEDMLLMLGAKISRHLVSPLVVPSGGLIRRDVADALSLLSAERDAFDWDSVARSAAALSCSGVLHRLVRDAEAQAGRALAPAGVLARLAPGPLEGRFLAMAARAAEQEEGEPRAAGGSSWKLVLRLWPGYALFQHLRNTRRRLAGLAHVLGDRVNEVLWRVERRLRASTRPARRRLVPVLRRLRPGFGSICELDPGPAVPEDTLCPSHAARAGHPLALDAEAARVLHAIRRLLPGSAELARLRAAAGAHLEWRFSHHCERILFRVDGASRPRRP
jgi:hypothetical protein